jgi:glycosyltransferase involved in cell wall biosynthesis
MMPLVSVITPTKGADRYEVIFERCVPSVQAQTYQPVEHLIVSGEHSPNLRDQCDAAGVIYWEADESEPMRDVGSRARNFGVMQANGKYIAYLDDDSAFHPEHIEKLVGMLAGNPTCDFVYSRFVFHWGDGRTQLGGAAPPIFGRIDCSSIVHRSGFLEKFGEWPVPNTYPDAEAASRWLSNGATWMFYGQPTFDYHYETPGVLYPGRERAIGVPGPA